MAARPAQSARREPAFERLWERHAANVYRYALALLGDAGDAERVTRATFASAHAALERGMRPASPETWLIRIAHALCRKQDASGESVADELAYAAADDAPAACPDFEALISRELDAPLARAERELLYEHLRGCDACRSAALGRRAARAAVRALRGLPLPDSLADG